MSITAGQRQRFDDRSAPRAALGYVYIHQPDLVVTGALDSVTYLNGGINQLGVTGMGIGSLDVARNMTLELRGAGGVGFFGSQRVRKEVGPTQVPVGRSSRGRLPGELDVNNAATVYIYDERRIWRKPDYIAPNAEQLKDSERYNLFEAQPPQANMGPDVLKLIQNASDTVDITLDALDADCPSYATYPSATLDTYSWSARTILLSSVAVAGSVSSSSVTVRLPRGAYWIKLTIIDSNGEIGFTERLIVVALRSDCYPVQIGTHTITPEGSKWTFEINGTRLPSSIRPEAKVLFAGRYRYGDYGDEELRFSGWLGKQRYDENPITGTATISIECYDVAAKLNNINLFPQSVARAVSAGLGGWYVLPELDVDRFLFYLLKWHSNALELADYKPSGVADNYPMPRFTTSGSTLWQQCQHFARAIAHRFTCTSYGRLQVIGDPLVLPTPDQATTYSLPTQRSDSDFMTLNRDDYGSFRLQADLPLRYYWHTEDAVIAGTDADSVGEAASIAPGATPGQGPRPRNVGKQLVVNQTELNVRAGHRYALANSPFGPVRLQDVKPHHVIEPADLQWIRWKAGTNATTRYGLDAAGQRCLVDEISNRYDHQSGRKTSTWSLTIEQQGEIAEDRELAQEQASDEGGFDTVIVETPKPQPLGEALLGIPPAAGNIVAILESGAFAVTSDFDTRLADGGPSWTVYDHFTSIGSTNIIAWVVDPKSTSTTGLDGWLVTNRRIYYVEDAETATPTFTQQYDFGNDSNFASIEVADDGLFVVVARINTVATDGEVIYSVDGGSNWSSKVVSDVTSDVTHWMPPALQFDHRTAGTIFVWFTATGMDTDNLHISRDFCATFEIPLFFGNNSDTGAAHIPRASNRADYFFVASGAQVTRRPLSDPTGFPTGTGQIQPVVGGSNYSPGNLEIGSRTMASSENDANNMVIVATGGSEVGVFATTNAMTPNDEFSITGSKVNWVTLHLEVGGLWSYVYLLNNASELYVIGDDFTIEYTSTPFQAGTLESRAGNLATTADVIGIGGYQ